MGGRGPGRNAVSNGRDVRQKMKGDIVDLNSKPRDEPKYLPKAKK